MSDLSGPRPRFEKHFTPAEAQQMLPLVKKIVKEILDISHDYRALATMLQEDPAGHPQLDELLDQVESLFSELAELGCYYKDWSYQIGLVDFPAIIEGQEVFLCWRSDEADIRYYHGIDAGYAGRRKIPSYYFRNGSSHGE